MRRRSNHCNCYNVCHIKEMETYHRNNPASWNYHYDSIGNLTRDLNEGILEIYWTVTDKGREGFFEHRTRINERRFKKYLRMNELQATPNGHHGIRHSSFFNTLVFPGRAVRYLPAPPQTRTSGFPAYGSSDIGFAKHGCGRSWALIVESIRI